MSGLERIAALLREAHIDRGLAAPAAIAPLADERRRATGARSVDDYAALVARDAAELARLRALVTVPETWMFRYPASFELLRARLLEAAPRSFRALCVACATGAEPFSVAATALAAGVPAVQVLGIDPNPEAIARARAADLGPMAARGGIPSWAGTLVTVDASGAPRLADAVRNATEFREGAAPAALADLPAGGFDAVFCRNLAIYLSPEGREAIGARLAALAAPGGMIFLGHAERASHFGLGHGWEQVACAEPGTFAIARRAASTRTPAADALAAAARAPARRPVPAARKPGAPEGAPARPAPAPRATADHAAPAATLDHARALADRGELAAALDAARALHDAGDRSVDLLELLGTLHLATGHFADAEAALRQAVYLDPANAAALVQLGVLAERRGDAELAERYRTRAARASA